MALAVGVRKQAWLERTGFAGKRPHEQQDERPLATTADYQVRSWTSRDGLRLHFRDYPGSATRPPILCLPGLTRNARDFEGLAPHIAARSGRGNVTITNTGTLSGPKPDQAGSLLELTQGGKQAITLSSGETRKAPLRMTVSWMPIGSPGSIGQT